MSPRPPAAVRRRTAATAAVCLGAALLTAATSASASQLRPTADASPSSVAVVVDPGAATEGSAYWTPERRAAATPLGGPSSSSPSSSTPGADVSGSAAQAPGRHGQQVAPVSHIGRLYLVRDDGGHWCSANVVRSGNRSTIATAGHCVSEKGEFSREMVFYPAYEHGESDLGAWPVVGGNVTDGWFQDGDADDDAAFLAVAGDAGAADLQSVAGASPVVFDAARVQRTSGYGYPVTPPYDGETLTRCQGTTTPKGEGEIGFLCDMTFGVSGGPMFIGDDADGTQFSDLAEGDVRHCDGPAWGAAERSAYEAAAAITP